MSGCGCGGQCDRGCQERRAEAVRQHLRARALMCVTCPHAEGRGRPDGYCRLQGQPLTKYATGRNECPIGRHPDREGVVRWLGVRWLGVPAPLRWGYAALWRPLGLPRLSGPLPGCGCVVRLKRLSLRLWRVNPGWRWEGWKLVEVGR